MSVLSKMWKFMFLIDRLPWPGNAPKDKHLYENLVNIIGTEIYIYDRQRLIIIQDMINNLFESNVTEITSGSLAEGLDLPGSDIDRMYILNAIDVVQSIQNTKHPIQHTTLVMESDNEHPGFTRLRLIADSVDESELIISECYEGTTNGLYLSVKLFLNKFKQKLGFAKFSSHGPCFSDTGQNMDLAVCLRSKNLPYSARPWVRRHRHQWPPNFVINKIQTRGCLLVPIGPRSISDNSILWRLSFSMAEKQLVHSFNYTQLLCYGLLKLTLKHIINTNDDVKDLLCSYFMKTALFWVSEEVDIEIFQLIKLFYCFFLCLDKLILWINNCYCPNYFIPKHNMFLGKIDQSNNKRLQNVLDCIRCCGINGLINNLFSTASTNLHLLSTNNEMSSMMLDFFVYKCHELPGDATNISRCYKLLHFAYFLQMFESSKFINEIYEYYYMLFSKWASQFLPPPNTITKTNNIQKLYHRHLQDGIRTDAVSGWLLYASFYYVIGQYSATLRLTEYVISRCKPGMVYLDFAFDYGSQIDSYRRNVHSKIPFKDKIKLATVAGVVYTRHSSLIPEELKLEVEEESFFIPPVVLSYFLRFLCHHHLGDTFNRQHALHNLFVTVKDKYFVSLLEISDSITILGVCYEISGDTGKAYQCYDEAMQCEECVCHTAEARKLKLSLALS